MGFTETKTNPRKMIVINQDSKENIKITEFIRDNIEKATKKIQEQSNNLLRKKEDNRG